MNIGVTGDKIEGEIVVAEDESERDHSHRRRESLWSSETKRRSRLPETGEIGERDGVAGDGIEVKDKEQIWKVEEKRKWKKNRHPF